MVHHDLRVEWIRQRVSAGFNLTSCPECFDDLLSRDDGEAEGEIIRYLNVVSVEDSSSCLLFFKTVREKEIEVEIPVDKKNEDSSDPDMKSRTQSGAGNISASEETNKESPSQMTEVKVVYYTELHVAVNHHPEKFLNSRVFCFLRNTKEPIAEPLDMNEANILMPQLFDISMHSGYPLQLQQNSLAHMYIPTLTAHQMTKTGGGYEKEEACPEMEASGEDEEETPVKPSGQFKIRDELLNRMHKFLGVISTTLPSHQIEDEISLHIPDLDLDSGVDVLLSDPEMLEKLEQCVMNWQTQITIVIEEQQNTKPQAPDPMAEIVLWQERASVLGALSQQLKQPVVEKILEVMTKADANIIQTLNGTVTELTKYCLESEDNVSFLKTLERHFMNLATGANFGVILETIPDLMESLQIVWMISCHYNTNERMVPLMERIAWQLCERVAQVIDIHTLFKDKREVAISKVHEAKQVLDQWKFSYFEKRADIEEFGRGPRWEFDRKRLFERSDYMASVCQDLYNVLHVSVYTSHKY